MEKLLNDFTVHRPIAEAWAVLTDVERIAPCLPGAQLEEVEGDVFRGVVKVKLGAISAAFKGQARFVERNDEEHHATLHAEGRDTGGKGNAAADITARLEAIDATTTQCHVEADLHITGKVAQFGRGIMADVSKRLIAQFAHNLNTMIEEDQGVSSQPGDHHIGPVAESTATDAAATGVPAAAAAATVTATAATSAPASEADTGPTAGPTVRKIEGPAAEPIELSGLAGGAVLKRALPLAGGLAILLLVVRWLRRR